MSNVFVTCVDYLKKDGIKKFIFRIVQWIPEYIRWKRLWVRAELCRRYDRCRGRIRFRDLKKQSKVDSFVKYKKIEGGIAYCKRTGQSYEVLNCGEKIEVLLPASFEERKDVKTIFDCPPIYLTSFTDVDVYGATNLITMNDTALSDLYQMDQGRNRYDIEGSCIVSCQREGKWLYVACRNTDIVIEEAINCLGWACWNYYHFLFEILSRLAFVDGREEYQLLPILVDAVVLKIPQMKDLLDRVNYYHHPIIPVEEYARVRVKKLVFVSRNLWMAPGFRSGTITDAGDYMFSHSVVQNIRERVLTEQTCGQKKSYKKIYLSRRKCKVQRLVNTDEIEQIFEDSGFQMVFPEDLSFDEEVAVFNDADVIVGVTGAAFSNIVFCHEGVKIGVIIPGVNDVYFFSNIAHMINAEFTVLGAEIVQKGEQASSDTFRLDEAKCRRFISTLCGF